MWQFLLKLYYFRRDFIWPSRRWNWNRSEYVDLSGKGKDYNEK